MKCRDFSQLGANVWIATPPKYAPDRAAIQWAIERGHATRASCTITNDPIEAVCNADVIYTDVWTSMGQEVQKVERDKIFRPYQVNSDLSGMAKPDAIFMHCLPAHRGQEVTPDVIDSVHSVVFQQAENRLHAQKAIMLELMKHEVAEGLRLVARSS